MKNHPFQVSVVMPTYNRLPILKRVLAGLAQQTFPSDCFEVVVVSDGSTDGTNEYLQETETPFPLRLFIQQNAGPAAARNRGVQEAGADLILFLDDDVVPAPNLIEAHAAAHQQYPGEGVVFIGPMLSPTDFPLSPWVQWMQDRLAEQYQSMAAGEWEATARQFYTGNASLPRHIFLEHHGFDVSLLRAEDVELAFRLAENGVAFQFCQEAAGYHYEQRTFASWVGIAYAYGGNDVLFATEKGQSWLLPNLYKEYKQRNILVRGLTRCCLDRKPLTAVMTQLFKNLANFGARLSLPGLSRVACSSLFNLYYYQGVADKLGGRQLFFSAGGLNDGG